MLTALLTVGKKYDDLLLFVGPRRLMSYLTSKENCKWCSCVEFSFRYETVLSLRCSLDVADYFRRLAIVSCMLFASNLVIQWKK